MTSALDLLKRPLVVAVLAGILGLLVGIPLGWATVRVVNTTPAVMRPDLQEDYLRMAIESFQVNRDPNLAVQALGRSRPGGGAAVRPDPAESRRASIPRDHGLRTGDPGSEGREPRNAWSRERPAAFRRDDRTGRGPGAAAGRRGCGRRIPAATCCGIRSAPRSRPACRLPRSTAKPPRTRPILSHWAWRRRSRRT